MSRGVARAGAVLFAFGAAGALAAGLLGLGAVSGAAADPGPAPTAQPNVTVQIPGDTSSPGTGSGGSGGSGGHGGGSTPAPTPTPTPSPAPPPVTTDPVPGAAKLTVRPATAHIGEQVSVSAGGYAPNEAIQVVVYPERIGVGTYQADSSGNLFARFTLTKKLGTGPHTVQAQGWQSLHAAAGPLTIVSGAAAAPGLPPLAGILIAAGALAIAALGALIAILNGWLPAIFGGKLVA